MRKRSSRKRVTDNYRQRRDLEARQEDPKSTSEPWKVRKSSTRVDHLLSMLSHDNLGTIAISKQQKEQQVFVPQGRAASLKPLPHRRVGPAQAILQFNRMPPSQPVHPPHIQQFPQSTVGLRCIEHQLSLTPHHPRHHLRQLPDRQVVTGPDVHQRRGIFPQQRIKPRQAPEETRKPRPHRLSAETRAAAFPSPHRQRALALRRRRCTFLSSAESTWDVIRSKLSSGPYNFVGIAARYRVPYCRCGSSTSRCPQSSPAHAAYSSTPAARSADTPHESAADTASDRCTTSPETAASQRPAGHNDVTGASQETSRWSSQLLTSHHSAQSYRRCS